MWPRVIGKREAIGQMDLASSAEPTRLYRLLTHDRALGVCPRNNVLSDMRH